MQRLFAPDARHRCVGRLLDGGAPCIGYCVARRHTRSSRKIIIRTVAAAADIGLHRHCPRRS